MGPRDAVVLFAAIAGTSLAIGLGFWQLDRGAQKTARQQALDSRAASPPLAAADLARQPGAAAEAQRFRRVAVTGRYVGERTVFLENRQMAGRVGFVVCTPLAIEGSRDVVLVQRGFAPRRFDDRTALPQVATPSGTVRVEGIVATSPARLYELGTGASGVIRQNLDLAAFAAESGLALLPVSIVEHGTAVADGLSREWDRPAADVHKHHGYAFQWFAIAAVISSLYVWFRVIVPRRQRA